MSESEDIRVPEIWAFAVTVFCYAFVRAHKAVRQGYIAPIPRRDDNRLLKEAFRSQTLLMSRELASTMPRQWTKEEIDALDDIFSNYTDIFDKAVEVYRDESQ